MRGQTLIKLFKDGKELPALLAIGPIIRPYKGERVDNKVVLEFQTIPEELSYLGRGHLTVKVKTPRKEIAHRIYLVPENIYDEWKVEIQDEPSLNEGLFQIFCSLYSYLKDEDLKSILNSFCTFLLPKTENFKKSLSKLEDIAIKRPVWFVNIVKYEPLKNNEVYYFSLNHWIPLSNPDYDEELFIAFPDKKLELAPTRSLENFYTQELWKNLKQGFAALLILTPEIFRLEVKIFGKKYAEIWKDFESEKIMSKLLGDTPLIKGILRTLIEEIPYDYIKVATFDNKHLDGSFNELLEYLKEFTDKG